MTREELQSAVQLCDMQDRPEEMKNVILILDGDHPRPDVIELADGLRGENWGRYNRDGRYGTVVRIALADAKAWLEKN